MNSETLMAAGTIADAATVGNRELGARVWAMVVGSGDQAFITEVVDMLTTKLAGWMRTASSPRETPPLTPPNAPSTRTGPLDLTERAASLLVVDLVNLALADQWDKRAERLQQGRSMQTLIAAGEQAMSALFDLPDATRRSPVGLN